jgi:uncharacterized protein (DUF1697 family)
MNTYISLLRGINVSGQKKINMKDLKELYESIGLQEVLTYIQSRNVIFKNDSPDIDTLTQQIEKAIFDKYAFEVAVVIRTPTEMKTIMAESPYQDKSTERVYFALLKTSPDTEKVGKLDPEKYLPDAFAVSGKTIYFFVESYGTSKLSNNLFESKLKVVATTRNYNTMLKLIELATL